MSDKRVEQERTALGIELGSTRVKAVLVDDEFVTIASGGHEWRSSLEDGHWTYSLASVWTAVQGAFRELKGDFLNRHGEELVGVGALGFSGMMHGYLAFDADDRLLTPFRTWQDTTTADAASELSQLFQVNIPMRWSIAHLYQAILDGEEHVQQVAKITTLAGYVHRRLSGEWALGVGDASGMFPIDPATGDYDAGMLEKFDKLTEERGLTWRVRDLLPAVLRAGGDAGRLTAEGAMLLDPTDTFRPGARMAPAEGDAGTGMVATNTVRPRTANVSAGTSIFAMVVLEHPLAALHEELDPVMTPDGRPVVMVHCNNGAADLQDWVTLLGEAAGALGAVFDVDTLFRVLYEKSLEGEADADGLVAFNFRAGEPIAGVDEGRPMFLRLPEKQLDLANFMRSHLYGALAVLRMGFDVLREERAEVTEMFAHGGLFRTKGVAQRYLSAALEVPVTVSETASEGGAWGMALLAALRMADGEALADWLDHRVFVDQSRERVSATEVESEGFNSYMQRYRAALTLQRAAANALPR